MIALTLTAIYDVRLPNQLPIGPSVRDDFLSSYTRADVGGEMLKVLIGIFFASSPGIRRPTYLLRYLQLVERVQERQVADKERNTIARQRDWIVFDGNLLKVYRFRYRGHIFNILQFIVTEPQPGFG